MKLFKLFGAIALAALAMPAHAQFTGGSSVGGGSTADITAYNRLSLSYNNTGLSGEDDFEFSLNGVGLEYTYGLPLSSSTPIFLELGAKAQFMLGSYDSEDYEDYTEKYKFLTLGVPVNLTYAFQINERFSLAPYAGINFKVHVLGERKGEYDGEYDIEDGKTLNLFDKDDMGGKDSTWNRFQMGWQIGLGARIDRYYLGLSYGTDFLKLYKHKKDAIDTGNFTLSLGYCF